MYQYITFRRFLTSFFCILSSLIYAQTARTTQVSMGDVVLKKSKYLVLKDYSSITHLEFYGKLDVDVYRDTLKQKKPKKDSLAPKVKLPKKYVYTIEAKDKLKLIHWVNQNKYVLDYAKFQPASQIVTGITFSGIDKDFQKLIVQKKYGANLFQKKEKQFLAFHEDLETVITLNPDKILNTKTAYLCWGETENRNIEVIDLVSKKCDCPKGTSVKYDKVEEDAKLSFKEYLKLNR